jgi:hypothetical protein
MSRRIIAAPPTHAPAAGTPTPDDYVGRLLKYIPAELVGLYLAARGVVPDNANDLDETLWIIALVTWILVPIYLYVVTTRGHQEPLFWQITFGTIAFPVWVFSIGGHPVTSIAWYAHREFVGSLVLMFVTVVFGCKEQPSLRLREWLKRPNGPKKT